MTDSTWFFLYTPIPYLIAMYLVAYRRDLGRMRRRLQDSATKGDWWAVCKYLGLIGSDAREPSRRLWMSPVFLAALLTSLISLSWIVIPIHSSWYLLCLLQAVATLPLLLQLVRMSGPIPYRPYRDVLPFPRLGTRIKHLKELKGKRSSP